MWVHTSACMCALECVHTESYLCLSVCSARERAREMTVWSQILKDKILGKSLVLKKKKKKREKKREQHHMQKIVV